MDIIYKINIYNIKLMIVDLVAILSISFAGCVSIIHAIQASKCSDIECCCLKLHRVLKTESEDDQPINNQNIR